MALVVTRKQGESIYIGDSIRITLVEVKSANCVKVEIQAPKSVLIRREADSYRTLPEPEQRPISR